jgi:hypothetical protein
MTTPGGIPNINLNITASQVTAKPRKMKTQWSQQAVNDFMSDWGASVYPRLPTNELDLMRDALEDPNYDPNTKEPYKGLWRWEDGRVATPEEVKKAHPEESLVEAAAREMRDEIDKEIMRELAAAGALSDPDVDAIFEELAERSEPEHHEPLSREKVRSGRLVKVLNALELSPAPRWAKEAAKRIVDENLV